MGNRYVWTKATPYYDEGSEYGTGGAVGSDGFQYNQIETVVTPSKMGFSSITSVKAYTGYSFDKTTGKYTGTGSSATMPSNAISNRAYGINVGSRGGTSYKYIPSADGVYLADASYAMSSIGSQDDAFWGSYLSGGDDGQISGARAQDLCLRKLGYSSGKYELLAYKFYKRAGPYPLTSSITYASSTSSTAYPTDGISGGYLYQYYGSDNVDPTSISYSSTVTPGKSTTITIAAPTQTVNHGTISYQYQYALNGSSTWTDIQTTTSKSISFTIPSSTKTIQIRVRAVDNIGFSSTTWRTGSVATAPQYTVSIEAIPAEGGTVSGAGTYTQGASVTVKATPKDGWEFVNWTEGTTVVSSNASYTFTITGSRSLTANFKQKLKLWVGVNGKARKGVALYVGVNGKARKAVGAWIGVNGKARKFL